MTYATELVEFARVPQWIVELHMSRCSLSYTVAPCAAVDAGDGARCSYSFPTCQDLANYTPTTRIFRFCLRDAAMPVQALGILPYLKEPVFITQKIDPKNAITQNERVVLTFYDEPLDRNFDADKLPGLTNTTTAGTFWRRFREIYRNYAERRVVIRPCFGGAGLTQADIEAQPAEFDGLMTNIEMLDNGLFKIEAVDKLKRVKKQIPAKISDTNTLQVALGNADGSITVLDATEFTDPASLDVAARVFIEIGYDKVRTLEGVGVFTEGSATVTGKGTTFLTDAPFWELLWAASDDEVHAQQVTAVASDTSLTLRRPYRGRGGQAAIKSKASEFVRILTVTVSTGVITIQRNQWWTSGISPVSFPVGTKVREVIWFGTTTDPGITNLQDVTTEQALDSLVRVLRLADVPDADIDLVGIAAERDLWHAGSNAVGMLALITDQENVADLIHSLSEIGLFNVFVNESALITAKIYAPPLPSVSLTTIDESSGFLAGTISVDDNDESSRLTRVNVAWDLRGDAGGDDNADYHRRLIRLNGAAESSVGFGDKKEKAIRSKYLYRDQTLAAISAAGRTLGRFASGAKTMAFSLELKDKALKLGDFFMANTSKIQTVTGGSVSKMFQVVRKKRAGLNRYDFEALEALGGHRVAFIGPNTMAATYDTRAAADIPYAYIGDVNNRVGTIKEDGFYIF